MEGSSEACQIAGSFLTAAAINNIILFFGVIATVMAIRSAKKTTVETIENSRTIAEQTAQRNLEIARQNEAHNREIAKQTDAHNREIAKQTETALFMFNSRSDRNLIAGYQTIRELHSSESENIVVYATNEEKRKSEKAEQIRYALNFWERVAVCIRHEIYCEKIIKDSMYTTVADAYERAEPYIRAVRKAKNTDTPYQDFEKLAVRWRADPLKPHGH